MSELLEHEAKALLRKYGISVPCGILATDAEQAVDFAKAVGAPVAMKVMAGGLIHKSAAGYVRLSVAPADVSVVYKHLWGAASRHFDVAGILVEKMAMPGVEIIIGVSSSDHFGPSIMYGAGGIGVECQKDVSFRLAPLTLEVAKEMIAETSTAERLLADNSLGNAAIDAIAETIVKIGGKDGLIFTELIQELDINPLVITPQGVEALDAYACLAPVKEFNWQELGVIDEPRRIEIQNELYSSLASLFSPQGIVVVGASSRPGKMGFEAIRCLVDYGYPGPIFGVNPSAANIYGCPAFPRISDLPHPVDRAIVVVAAAEVVEALFDCARTGVRVAHVYSAGFSEWQEDLEREQSIRELVKTTGMRVVGPNSNGAFCASSRLTKIPALYSPEGIGNISFISQSGTYTSDVIARSKVMGVPLAKALACGNCTDLGPIEYLLYCARDPETKIIAMYLETIENPGKFFRLAKQIDKPLILIKGGRTKQGDRVASTHTGALATNHVLWKAAAKQAGALCVEGVPELMDVLLGFSAFGAIPGPGLALFTSGGGIGVTATDIAIECGLNVPLLDSDVTRRLESYMAPGTSITNPVDLPVFSLKNQSGYVFGSIIEALSSDPQVGSVVAVVEMGSIFNYSRSDADGLQQVRDIVESLRQIRDNNICISLVLRSTGSKIHDDFVREVRPELIKNRIAVYESVSKAVKAHGKLAELGRAIH